MARTIQFPCCFCGKVEADHGIALVGKNTGEFEQQWWCHVECLLDRMVERARGAYEEAQLEEEEEE